MTRNRCIVCLARQSRRDMDCYHLNGKKDTSHFYICKTCRSDLMSEASRLMKLEEHRKKALLKRQWKMDQVDLKRDEEQALARRRRGVRFEITRKRWRQSHVKFQGGLCAICERPFDDERTPTLDHIVPMSRGGEHSYENTQALCLECHKAKDQLE